MKQLTIILITLIFLVACKEDKSAIYCKPPADFSFTIDYGTSDFYSSIKNQYTRGGICDKDAKDPNFHDSTITVTLSATEKQQIYNAILLADFWELPAEFEYQPRTCITPSTSDWLIITMNSETKRYNYSYSCIPLNKALAARYRMVVDLMKDIIENKKEVKLLPETCLMLL